MAFADDVFPPDDLCEICGGQLDDEIVIQEFADGSLARLCSECAAGAALAPEQHLGHDPIEPSRESQVGADSDPLERTRELLTPVVDLIGLQREMQDGLERLAASLESFAAGVFTENLDKTATVDDRVQRLERELDDTRARLREAEALLIAAGIVESTGSPEPTGTVSPTEPVEAVAPVEAAASVETVTEAAGFQDTEAAAAEAIAASEQIQAAEPISSTEEASAEAASASVPVEAPPPPVSGPEVIPPVPLMENAESAKAEDVASAGATVTSDTPATPPPAQPEGARHGFSIEEVQAAQRYFNESPFIGKTRDVQVSLGKPRASLTRAAGQEPRAFITIFWDIVWYQYLVDMRLDVLSDQRVVLHREGMDLDELAHQFKEKNAIVDDSGRLDASELEIKLLSDPTTLITEMTVAEERALEDATEEIWDQHTAPEFKWDD